MPGYGVYCLLSTKEQDEAKGKNTQADQATNDTKKQDVTSKSNKTNSKDKRSRKDRTVVFPNPLLSTLSHTEQRVNYKKQGNTLSQ